MFSIIYHCSYGEDNEEGHRGGAPGQKSFSSENSSENFLENSKNNANLLKSLEKFFSKNSEHIIIILSIILLFSFTILKMLFSFSISILLGIILSLILFLSMFYFQEEAVLDSIYNNRKILFIALLILNLLRIISSLVFLIGLILSVIFCLSFSSKDKVAVENSDNINIHPEI